MSSTRILRSVLVVAVAAALAVGPVGTAVAAPERGAEARAGWGVELGEWVEVVWGWLSGQGEDSNEDPTDLTDENQDNSNCEDCSDAGANLDPDG